MKQTSLEMRSNTSCQAMHYMIRLIVLPESSLIGWLLGRCPAEWRGRAILSQSVLVTMLHEKGVFFKFLD